MPSRCAFLERRAAMNKPYIIGMLLLASVLLVDRFVVNLPDWTAILIFMAAAVLLILSIVKSRKEKRNQA